MRLVTATNENLDAGVPGWARNLGQGLPGLLMRNATGETSQAHFERNRLLTILKKPGGTRAERSIRCRLRRVDPLEPQREESVLLVNSIGTRLLNPNEELKLVADIRTKRGPRCRPASGRDRSRPEDHNRFTHVSRGESLGAGWFRRPGARTDDAVHRLAGLRRFGQHLVSGLAAAPDCPLPALDVSGCDGNSP